MAKSSRIIVYGLWPFHILLCMTKYFVQHRPYIDTSNLMKSEIQAILSLTSYILILYWLQNQAFYSCQS